MNEKLMVPAPRPYAINTPSYSLLDELNDRLIPKIFPEYVAASGTHHIQYLEEEATDTSNIAKKAEFRI